MTSGNKTELPQPEKQHLRIGIVPLTDCAVIVAAREKGFFQKYGLDVDISPEVSWANIRDKVAFGALDAAQMLAPMPVASTLGIEAVTKPTVTAFSMGLNGNAITVSNELYAKMCEIDADSMQHRPLSAHVLKKVIDSRVYSRPLNFAMVFPVSSHNYQLRYWLASAGIDPDRDVRLTVIPPVHMVANLEAGLIDGYCVGEPWNSYAIAKGIGRVLVTGYEIWNNSPEKVLGVNREWAEKYPATHLALVVSLLEAARWLDEASNREETIQMLASQQYLDLPADILQMSMMGSFNYSAEEAPVNSPDFNVFYRYAANFPWVSHGQWFISQMIRWGQINRPLNTLNAASEIYLTDIYRQACEYLSIPVPTVATKTEGTHGSGWELATASTPIAMGSDRFIDGEVFRPDDLIAYLGSFAIHHMTLNSPAAYFANT